jgi:hypothetical protein
MKLKIRQNRVFAIVILSCAIFILFVSFLIGPSLNLIIGFLNLFIGIKMLTQPVLVITDQEIEIKNLLGMTMKRVPFNSYAELEIEEGSLYVNQGGMRTRATRVSRFLHHGPDLENLHELIAANKTKA